jgi:hypothetical protein
MTYGLCRNCVGSSAEAPGGELVERALGGDELMNGLGHG